MSASMSVEGFLSMHSPDNFSDYDEYEDYLRYQQSDESSEIDQQELEALLYSQIHYEPIRQEDDNPPGSPAVALHGMPSECEFRVSRTPSTETQMAHMANMVNFTGRTYQEDLEKSLFSFSEGSINHKYSGESGKAIVKSLTSTPKVKSVKPNQKAKFEHKSKQKNVISEKDLVQRKNNLDIFLEPENKVKALKNTKEKKNLAKKQFVVVSSTSETDTSKEELSKADLISSKKKITNLSAKRSKSQDIIVDDDVMIVTSQNDNSNKSPVISIDSSECSDHEDTKSTDYGYSDSDSDHDMLLGHAPDSDADIDLVNVRGMKHKKMVVRKVDLSHLEEESHLTLEDVHFSMEGCVWDVIDQDVYGDDMAGGRGGRYYRLQNLRCKNCDERGHFQRDCPKPKKLPCCILCGTKGHIQRHCPQQLCFNCNHPGHASAECDQPRRRKNADCHRCGMWGHVQQDCPDIWRQFHLTIKPGPLLKGKGEENNRRFCFNCGKKGHFGHECEAPPMDRYGAFTLPFIARYALPSAVKTMPGKRQHKYFDEEDSGWQSAGRGNDDPDKPSPNKKQKKAKARASDSKRHHEKRKDAKVMPKSVPTFVQKATSKKMQVSKKKNHATKRTIDSKKTENHEKHQNISHSPDDFPRGGKSYLDKRNVFKRDGSFLKGSGENTVEQVNPKMQALKRKNDKKYKLKMKASKQLSDDDRMHDTSTSMPVAKKKGKKQKKKNSGNKEAKSKQNDLSLEQSAIPTKKKKKKKGKKKAKQQYSSPSETRQVAITDRGFVMTIKQ